MSLGTTETVLSAGLPSVSPPKYYGPNIFEVEKIIDKRRVRKKLEYLVVWKGYPDSSSNTWEDLKSLAKCNKATNVRRYAVVVILDATVHL